MARITNRAAAALGGKNEAAKNSSDFSFRKSQGLSQRLDFLFHHSLIEAKLWEFFLKKSERQKRQPRPQGFSLKKWVGREKALASAGHVHSLNIPEKLIYMQPAGFALTEVERSNNRK